ncbi:protoporphyrinogen/coproporphyrinogen oxidase [Thiocapsa marina]|uniref:Amine oxidase n=1 Tax=Thiocapsa marina 5811 TaxID=768671 RepID=F9UEX4_9GAMM|nr:FAD-dependent oxidoreductase [Thiocapsa marina]EGV17445.1 amine oxidase [Thiocapsa marina 5811]
MTTSHHRFLILGAGPTGLGAALRLLELGESDFLLIEAQAGAGGLAASFLDEQGFTWDLGGHVQFSHYRAFDRYMDLALGHEGWIEHQRESWVWIRDRFVPYPLQYNLHRLPPEERWQCVEGLLSIAGHEPAAQPIPATARDFDEWMLATFGQGIADVFLRPYNFKVWAYPPDMMNATWIGERVALPDLRTVLKSLCLGEDNLSWGPNNRFRFPKRGGTGAIWTSLAGRIPDAHLRFGDAVAALDTSQHILTTASGNRFGYDQLISTLPLDRLALLIGDPELVAQTARLKYSSVHVIGIGLRGQPPESLRTKCWMYFPEDNCPFYRVTVFSNYSPENTPDPGVTWSLMAEVSESPCKAVDASRVLDDVVQGLLATRLIANPADILSRWYRRLEHGYPTPSVDRDSILEQVLPALETRHIYSRGRFGAWKYEVSNQDHAMMQGVEIIERLVNGREELTLNRAELVNGRYNEDPYPEWGRG